MTVDANRVRSADPVAMNVPSPSQRTLPVALRRVRAAFTLIELLMAISIIAILAGLLVGLAPVAGARMKESRTRAELERLTTAIEAYKDRFGVYPPDHVVGYHQPSGLPIVDPVINPLFYELSGLVVVNQRNGGYFVSLGDPDAAAKRLFPDQLVPVFGRDGFVNAAASNDVRRIFRYPFKEGQFAELSSDPDIEILVAPVPWPQGDANNPPPIDLPGRRHLNPWRYVSSAPTNNPGRFDLWCEYVVRGQRRIIGNWKN